MSSNENEVFRCPSQMPYRSFAPPFALAFSRGSHLSVASVASFPTAEALFTAAKAGGRQVFAVADEEGTIGLINGSEDSHWDGGEACRRGEAGRTPFTDSLPRSANNRKSFKAHHNAVFDLGWSEDDSVIVSASASFSRGPC